MTIELYRTKTTEYDKAGEVLLIAVGARLVVCRTQKMVLSDWIDETEGRGLPFQRVQSWSPMLAHEQNDLILPMDLRRSYAQCAFRRIYGELIAKRPDLQLWISLVQAIDDLCAEGCNEREALVCAMNPPSEWRTCDTYLRAVKKWAT